MVVWFGPSTSAVGLVAQKFNRDLYFMGKRASNKDIKKDSQTVWSGWLGLWICVCAGQPIALENWKVLFSLHERESEAAVQGFI